MAKPISEKWKNYVFTKKKSLVGSTPEKCHKFHERTAFDVQWDFWRLSCAKYVNSNYFFPFIFFSGKEFLHDFLPNCFPKMICLWAKSNQILTVCFVIEVEMSIQNAIMISFFCIACLNVYVCTFNLRCLMLDFLFHKLCLN